MEVEIETADQPGQYFPVTTPFGYFGSTWDNQKGHFGGVNFFLWSDGDDAQAGNIEKLSRLLAYRGDARYTVYGHEGIGVKPIGSNPWEKMKPRKNHLLAVRKDPGTDMNTYTSYFYNFDSDRWELYGCGQSRPKKNEGPDLIVGHFMEVLYPSPHIRRESRIRGWVMTENKEWFQLDEMTHRRYSGAKDMSHRRHGFKDGWFFMSTGGWFPNDIERDVVKLPKSQLISSTNRPEYLQGEHEKANFSASFRAFCGQN
jgi:hypothetical protein